MKAQLQLLYLLLPLLLLLCLLLPGCEAALASRNVKPHLVQRLEALVKTNSTTRNVKVHLKRKTNLLHPINKNIDEERKLNKSKSLKMERQKQKKIQGKNQKNWNQKKQLGKKKRKRKKRVHPRNKLTFDSSCKCGETTVKVRRELGRLWVCVGVREGEEFNLYWLISNSVMLIMLMVINILVRLFR